MEMPTHNGCYVGQRQIGLGSCICQLTLKGIELTTRALILECQAEQRSVACKPLPGGLWIAELSELLEFIDEIVTSVFDLLDSGMAFPLPHSNPKPTSNLWMEISVISNHFKVDGNEVPDIYIYIDLYIYIYQYQNMLKRQKHGQAKNQAFFQGPPIVEPPSYKLPISLPYFKGF